MFNLTDLYFSSLFIPIYSKGLRPRMPMENNFCMRDNVSFGNFHFLLLKDLCLFMRTGGRLTKNHLIEIVIFQLIESFNNESFIFYNLIEFFETFQLTEILK